MSKWGGIGFEISDVTGRGEGVVCGNTDVRKLLNEIEIPNFQLIVNSIL